MPTSTDRPELNMTLRVGGQLLSAQAMGLPDEADPAGPLAETAKAWLAGCARAQRLLMDSGAAPLFAEGGLSVEILGPAEEAGRARSLARAALRGGSAALMSLSGLLARAGLELAAQCASRAAMAGLGDPSQAQEPALSLGELGGRKAAVAMLPSASSVFDADGLAAAAPFWSPTDLAAFVVLHEAGHVLHLCGPWQDDPLLLGSQPEEGFDELLSRMGLTERARDAYGELCFQILMEGYADCFAAVSMGGGSARRAAAACRQIIALRGACIPAEPGSYGQGDFGHDAREALAELAERLDAMDFAPRGADIYRLCARAAEIGMLRWAQKLATSPEGALAGALWRRSASQALPGEGREQASRAASLPCFRELAARMGEEIADARHCAGLAMLAKMNELAGDPRMELAGSARQAAKARP